MTDTSMEDWFVPGILPMCLASCVYLFEQLEEERGNKRVAALVFLVACTLIAYVAYKKMRESTITDVRVTLAIEIIGTALVGSRIVQPH